MNKYFIDEHTLSVLHFDNKTNIVEDVCGNIWDILETESDNLYSKGKFDGCLDFTNNPYGYLTLNAPPNLLDITGNKPRTIDFWFYINSVNAYANIFGMGNCTRGKDFGIYISNSTTIGIYHYEYATHNASVSDLTKDWNHIALVYDGIYEYLFLNGRKIIQENISLNTASDYISINAQGKNSYVIHYRVPVKYDEFRISNIARWTEDFEIQSRPYTKNKSVYLDKDNYIYGCKKNT